MAVSQQIPAQRQAVTPDHERVASILSSAKGVLVGPHNPFVAQLVALIEDARREERKAAAIREDERRRARENERAAGSSTSSTEYRHPQGRYGPEGWLS